MKEAEVIGIHGMESSNENRELKAMYDRIKELRERFDSGSLVKDIKSLQDCSRIQNLSPGIRETVLKELQRFKLIKNLVDGEFI